VATPGSGASEVVAHNEKIKELMEKRSILSRPERWIESLYGLSYVDVFESKRDQRKIGVPVFNLKHRIEPITSLYADLAQAAAAVEPEPELKEEVEVKTAAKPKTAAEVAKGVIIGRRTIKLSKPQA